MPRGGGDEWGDVETGGDGEGMVNAFLDKAVRRGFVRKVYGILTAQVLVTCSIIAIFYYVQSVQVWMYEHPGIYISASVGTFVTIIVLACIPGFRRKSPGNYICLALFTVLEGILLGSLSAQMQGDQLFIAMVITAIITLSLTAFAFQTKWDFTMASGALLCLLMVLLCFGLTLCFIPSGAKWAHMLYAALGVLLFSLYIVFDTQLMLGGTHRYSISPEEYIFAALNLYLDIVNLFLMLLRIIGLAGR